MKVSPCTLGLFSFRWSPPVAGTQKLNPSLHSFFSTNFEKKCNGIKFNLMLN